MKCLRNWSSHGHLLDNANVGDIAFLALVGFRASFSVPGGSDLELRRYEHRLLGVVNTELDIADLPKRLAQSYVKAKGLLVSLVGEPSSLKKDGMPVPLQNRRAFGAIVNELANADSTPLGFGFPMALREMLVQSVILPRGPSVDGSSADNLNVIEVDFEHGLSKIWDQLPNWFKTASTRI
jgi:hypothetical protein